MQILASALPGFRDLRAPLTAGYLWLVFLWIWLKPDLTARPTNELAGAVYDLGKAAGPIWVGLAVGIVAYLIGAVSQVLSPAINWALDKIWQKLYHHFATRQFNSDGSKNKPLPKAFLAYHRDPLDKICDIALNRMYAYGYQNTDGSTPNYEEEVGNEASIAREGLHEEIKLPATLLLGKEPELFTEADRLKSESQFRLTIVPPLTVITVYIALTESLWWLLIMIPLLILVWQSHTRNLEYRYLMFGAIQRGVIDSESVEEFKAWVNSLHPESTSRTVDTNALVPGNDPKPD
ncbi:hypothetical protein [Mycolicibacterium smegmatis]|uniref:hypothetical protein n=1 Tax=Mycolicibacterium smegmatis TaxID=1772 RepID=UPI0013036A26|nr:hypothetical protein [Mycolicibacterium smegmatis]